MVLGNQPYSLGWAGEASTAPTEEFWEHKKPGDRITDLYDRRVLDAPLRKLMGLLAEIREGEFNPDEDDCSWTQQKNCKALSVLRSLAHQVLPSELLSKHSLLIALVLRHPSVRIQLIAMLNWQI